MVGHASRYPQIRRFITQSQPSSRKCSQHLPGSPNQNYCRNCRVYRTQTANHWPHTARPNSHARAAPAELQDPCYGHVYRIQFHRGHRGAESARRRGAGSRAQRVRQAEGRGAPVGADFEDTVVPGVKKSFGKMSDHIIFFLNMERTYWDSLWTKFKLEGNSSCQQDRTWTKYRSSQIPRPISDLEDSWQPSSALRQGHTMVSYSFSDLVYWF